MSARGARSARHPGRMAAAALAALIVVPSCASSRSEVPECTRPDDTLFVLMAQAVPSALRLPCIADLPAGWTYGGFLIRNGDARFWLESDRAGPHAVQVDLTRRCDVSEAVAISPEVDEAGARVFQEPITLPPRFSGNRYLVFEGGCVTYRYRFVAGAASTLVLEADSALAFTDRAPVVQWVRRKLGLDVCGAGSPPCSE